MGVREPVLPGGARPLGPYSPAMRAGPFLFISGQIAVGPDGKVRGTAGEQAWECLERLREVLEAAGAGLGDVVKVTVYLTDMHDFAAVNEVYSRYFPADPPARSCVQVAALPKGARVEIEAIAYLG